jgi:ankyrin repeat protein
MANDAKESSVPTASWKKLISDGDVEAVKTLLAEGSVPEKDPATGESPIQYLATILKRKEIVEKLGKQSIDAQRVEIFCLLLEHGASTDDLLNRLAHNDRDDVCEILLAYPVSKKEIKDAFEIADLSDAGNVCDLLEAHMKAAKKKK